MSESMEFDVIIVGGGVAGLSAAIKLRQLAAKNSKDISVCLVEKGSEIGAHILSGAVIEPHALDELIPDWKEKNAPLNTEVKSDRFLLIGKHVSVKLFTPKQMQNHGNYIISLGNLCRWLGEQAESLGVQIFAGFPAKEVLYDNNGKVAGILTGEFGRAEDGSEKDGFQPSMELRAKYTLFAEGCRGSLTKTLEEKFDLRKDCCPQTYGIGIKEMWEVKPENHNEGSVTHTVGWPMDTDTYGGSFMYHMENNLVSIGFVVGLDYSNPSLNPFKEFQRFKTHKEICKVLEGGKRISYGARALNEGGYQSIPKLTFDGGAIIGCGAGFMNVPKIKGTHTAMKSGMIASEAVFDCIVNNGDISAYEDNLKKSWVYEELYTSRNIRPSFRHGIWGGLLYSAIDTYIFRGKAPWTFKHKPDYKSLKPAKKSCKIRYPEPDSKVSFDLMSSVFLSSTNHEENQPIHLKLEDIEKAIKINMKEYNSPESNYCPAGVYEIIENDKGKKELKINAQNCLHCKTCDIKDPSQNITWTTPEGGGGPNYSGM